MQGQGTITSSYCSLAPLFFTLSFFRSVLESPKKERSFAKIDCQRPMEEKSLQRPFRVGRTLRKRAKKKAFDSGGAFFVCLRLRSDHLFYVAITALERHKKRFSISENAISCFLSRPFEKKRIDDGDNDNVDAFFGP